MHDPVLRFGAELFGKFFGAVGENVAEPGFAPGAALQQSFDGFEVAPFQFQAVGAVGTEHAFFPSLERQPRAAGIVAALDAEIVDALGEIKDVVALESEIVKSVHPLAAGVEVADLAFESSFADLHIPRAHARALKAGPQRNTILIQTFRFIGDDRAAPIELRDRAPVLAVADARQTFFDGGFSRRDSFCPAHAGTDQAMLVVRARPLGAPGDKSF